MYQEIEKIIVRTLSPFEYEMLEKLKTEYDDQQIISTYKQHGDKPINYIVKAIKSQKKTPTWLNMNIENEEIDEETEKEFNDFKEFLEEFRK